MALIQIGSAGSMLNQASNALGSNAVTNALGVDFGGIATPSKFLTKFTPSTVFTYRSLAYEIRANKNFDVIFHWHPRTSQIRTMFSNAFSAVDTDDINLLVRSVRLPDIRTTTIYGNDHNDKFRCVMPGLGVNGSGSVSMTFLNTEFSYVDHCFYQWLSETESPFWIYGPMIYDPNGTSENLRELGNRVFRPYTTDSTKPANEQKRLNIGDVQNIMKIGNASKLIYLESESETAPFTRADIEIKTYSNNMKEMHSIWFFGAFPQRIQLDRLDHQPVNQNELEGYAVDFAYDSMCISSPFAYNSYEKGEDMSRSDSAAQMFKSSGLSNSAAWTAGLYEDTLSQVANTYLAKASRKLNKILNKRGSELGDKLQKAQNRITA